MYLDIECELCKKTRRECECTFEDTLAKVGRVELHTYIQGNRRAEVMLYTDVVFGCEFYETVDEVEVLVHSSIYNRNSHGQEEAYAEEQAEDYVRGATNFEDNKT